MLRRWRPGSLAANTRQKWGVVADILVVVDEGSRRVAGLRGLWGPVLHGLGRVPGLHGPWGPVAHGLGRVPGLHGPWGPVVHGFWGAALASHCQGLRRDALMGGHRVGWNPEVDPPGQVRRWFLLEGAPAALSHLVTDMGYCAPSPGWRRSIRMTTGRGWAVATNGSLP